MDTTRKSEFANLDRQIQELVKSAPQGGEQAHHLCLAIHMVRAAYAFGVNNEEEGRSIARSAAVLIRQ